MTCDTINDARTTAGNAEGAVLAERYRIVKQLGQGGMGSVWLAEDAQLDNKPFAIKMLPAILVSNKRAYRQLKDEALVAMQLVHPNIVQVRAFEENDGNPFLVMDYVGGQTLDDYLAEHVGGLPEADVLRILRPIANALDYAHAKGVVHRDVKPGNVMIAKDGTPYILDFGIAREIQETMTRVTGKLSSGTLLYMSPEQLMGEQPKPAQDIYSFAAMAYECLKGEPPFSHGQIEFQIMNKRPGPLPTEILTGKAAILAAGVMAGLAKRPEDRPATCAAVLEGDVFSRKERKDVVANGNDRVEHVERVDGVGRARTPAASQGGARSRAAVKGILAAILLAVLAGGAWWWASRKTSGMSQNDARKRSGADTEEHVDRDLLRDVLKDSYRAKATEAVSNARAALEILYMRENRWPHEIFNATKYNGYYVMDEKVAIALFKSNCLAVDCKETSENGRTIYKLRGKDRCGIVDPWAQDVLKNANANADGMSLLSLKVSSGGTVEDHRIYFAVDKDDDGFVDSSEGAPVNRVRAKAITWCAGADGVLATDADNVYSWQRAQEVREMPMSQPTILSVTNAVAITPHAPVVQSAAESTELVRLREELRREREKRKVEQSKSRDEKRQAEIEAWRRRHYPEYYANEDARKAAAATAAARRRGESRPTVTPVPVAPVPVAPAPAAPVPVAPAPAAPAPIPAPAAPVPVAPAPAAPAPIPAPAAPAPIPAPAAPAPIPAPAAPVPVAPAPAAPVPVAPAPAAPAPAPRA